MPNPGRDRLRGDIHGAAGAAKDGDELFNAGPVVVGGFGDRETRRAGAIGHEDATAAGPGQDAQSGAAEVLAGLENLEPIQHLFEALRAENAVLPAHRAEDSPTRQSMRCGSGPLAAPRRNRQP